MSFRKRFRLFFTVIAAVSLLVVIRVMIHAFGLEFLTLNALVPSIVAGAIFIIGFLLSNIFSDYKEAERLPTQIRMALEAIHDDVAFFAEKTPGVDIRDFRRSLTEIVAAIEDGLGTKTKHADLTAAMARVNRLASVFAKLEDLGMSSNFVVRLRNEQDVLRKALDRIHHMQRMQFVPSVHVLVQTLVVATIFLLLFVKSEQPLEAALVFGFVSYMFIYALYLIETFDQPFRKGENSVDDVSLFLLRDFVANIERQNKDK